MGGTNDEHAEMCQKLLHIAYQHHANKTSDAIEQIADYLSRLAAMKHAERWLVLSNADLVRSAELGIHANVVYLLENGVVDALGVDDVTGRCPAYDALAAACRRGDADTAILLLRERASASGCTAERCAHLITAARSPAREGAIATVGMLLWLWRPPEAQPCEVLLGNAHLEVAGATSVLHRIVSGHEHRLHAGFRACVRSPAEERPPAVGMYAVRAARDAKDCGLLRVVQHQRVDARDNHRGHLHVSIPTLPYRHAARANPEELAKHCIVVCRFAVCPQCDAFL